MKDEIKTEGIVQALRRMAAETGSLNCLGCGYEYNCGLCGCAVLMEAANQLERLARRLNDEEAE